MKLAPVLQVLDLTLTDLYVFQTAKKYFSKTKKGVYFGYQTFVLSCDPTLVIPQLKFEVSFLRLQKHDLVHPDKMGTRAKWLVDCLGIKEKSHVLDGNIEERREAFRVKLYSEHGNEDPVLLVDFYQYWTEVSQDGRKMRFEDQDFFSIGKRLSTLKNIKGNRSARY